ncbi:unnamed protein product, partial [Meganyctiphanes norvegica]
SRIINWKKIFQHDNDIALLELPSELIFLPTIQPICLGWPEDVSAGEKATAIGWGKIEWEGELSSKLLKVEVELLTNTRCKELYAWAYISKNMLCAYIPDKDACQGDSGGPLMVIQDGSW